MKVTPSSAYDRARDDAIDWLLRLAEEPDDLDMRVRFHAWLAADPAHQLAWDHANKVSGLVGQSQNMVFMDDFVPRPSASHPSDDVADVGAGRNRWPRIAMATMAACLALLLAPLLLLHLQSDYRTGTGQQQLVTLEDGSNIRLGPQSAVAVSFADRERKIRLIAGEAYFEAARDESRPFRVVTDEAVTTVLGTGFNIRRGEDSTEIAVRHGQVRVERAGSASARQILTDGEWALVNENHMASGDGAATLVGSWSSGKLAVVDRPVGEVVADIRRSYRGMILLRDRELAARSVSGSFDTADPLQALTALVRPHGASVHQITPWIIIIS